MEQKLFDSQTVVADTESNKTILNELKIAYKEFLELYNEKESINLSTKKSKKK